jgi:SAM-dependent methyltransferase
MAAHPASSRTATSDERLYERMRWVYEHLPLDIDRLLDVGCHDGAGTAAFRRRSSSACGVDTNLAALQSGQHRFPAVQLVAASAASLPFADAAFDCVVFSEVLEHVPGHLEPACIAEIRRVLRVGGTLVITTPHRGTFWWLDPLEMKPNVRRLASKAHGRREPIKGHKHYRLDELTRLLSPHFTIQTVERVGQLLYPLAYWGHLLPFGVGQQPRLVALWRRMMDYDYTQHHGPDAYNVCIVATAR